jgi:hypothetical protein
MTQEKVPQGTAEMGPWFASVEYWRRSHMAVGHSIERGEPCDVCSCGSTYRHPDPRPADYIVVRGRAYIARDVANAELTSLRSDYEKSQEKIQELEKRLRDHPHEAGSDGDATAFNDRSYS